MPDSEVWNSPVEDAKKYVARLERQVIWVPLIAAVFLLGSYWWYGLGIPVLVLGAIIIALWREVLETRVQLARISYIWMRNKSKGF